MDTESTTKTARNGAGSRSVFATAPKPPQPKWYNRESKFKIWQAIALPLILLSLTFIFDRRQKDVQYVDSTKEIQSLREEMVKFMAAQQVESEYEKSQLKETAMDCPPCVLVILEGGELQGHAALLSQFASTSCELADYVRGTAKFDAKDLLPLADFHTKYSQILKSAAQELSKINQMISAKYR